MDTVFIVNHNLAQECGVYKHGHRMAEILQKSKKYNFLEVKANSLGEYLPTFEKYKPIVCFYNYYPGVLNWAVDVLHLPSHHIGLVHEVTHHSGPQGIFKKWVATDPSFPESPYYYKTVRPIFKYKNKYPYPDIPTIGSFGFAFPNKGFDRIVDAVCKEFDRAIINFHITIAAFNGGYGHQYLHDIINVCESKLKEGIQLNITTDYKDDIDVVDFLAKNSLNCLFYDFGVGRGISSAIDYCVSAGRPISITTSQQFRHVQGLLGSYPEKSLKESLEDRDTVLNIKKQWSHDVFIKEYEDIVEKILHEF